VEVFGKSQTGAQTLGVYGAITLLMGGVLLAVAMNGVFLLIPLAYAATAGLLFSREAFRDLKQLVKLTPLIVVSSTLLWQEEYPLPSGMPFLTSSPFFTGFLVGVEMSARAVVMVLAVSVFMRTVKVSELSCVLERASGSESFSFVFGLALNIAPYLERIGRDTLNAIKLKGGFQLRNLASSVSHLLSSTTLNALAKCQDISYAAEARAFGSGRSMTNSAHRDSPTASRIDLSVLIATTVVVVLSFILKA